MFEIETVIFFNTSDPTHPRDMAAAAAKAAAAAAKAHEEMVKEYASWYLCNSHATVRLLYLVQRTANTFFDIASTNSPQTTLVESKMYLEENA